ncbi:MAG: type II secretion system F family protein [Nanoarchaeota archaeon]|nr:type II secretion system F family protein [Nanoarchaeota archaeon]
MKYRRKQRRLPTLFFSEEKILSMSRSFRAIGYRLHKSLPLIGVSLREAGLEDIDPIIFLSSAFVVALTLFLVIGAVFSFFLFEVYIRGLLNNVVLYTSLFLIFIVPIIYFLYYINYPKLIAGRRQAQIEEKLVFAMRDIMIKVRSGVSLFNAILDVSAGDYGLVSEEFKIVVEEIESGIAQETALENLSRRTSSQVFRRSIDILTNAMRSGSDVAGTLGLINDMLVKKQQSDMISYAAELTPFSMAFMLVAIVFPSLGMSVFIILGSMLHINVIIFIYILPVFLVVFQVFFVGLVKSRRPAIGV